MAVRLDSTRLNSDARSMRTLKVGDRIVVTADKAPLRAIDAETGTVPKGSVLVVKNVNGDSLWVIDLGDAGTVKGWINRSDVIPFSQALDFFNEELKRNPTATAYNYRGMIWQEKGEYDIAIGDFNEAIRLDPKYDAAHCNRGNAYFDKRDYDRSVSDFDQAIRLAPNNALAWNNRAMVYAACPDAKHRDGNKALDDATRACEVTGWKVGTYLDTLAAAYAEVGNFDAAVIWQTKARDMVSETKKADHQSRLDLYKAHK